MNGFDWVRGFTLDFSLTDGKSAAAQTSQRFLSDMNGMFFDKPETEKLLSAGNPLIYEFYELDAPQNPGDLAFGTSILYPGKVGGEYHMTNGHFHTILDTAELYFCLRGKGGMLIENQEGDTNFFPLEEGKAVYVPKGYAHRSVNTGDTPFITFFAFRGDAGHDYASIKTKGYRKLVTEGGNGEPVLTDNPNWKE